MFVEKSAVDQQQSLAKHLVTSLHLTYIVNIFEVEQIERTDFNVVWLPFISLEHTRFHLEHCCFVPPFAGLYRRVCNISTSHESTSTLVKSLAQLHLYTASRCANTNNTTGQKYDSTKTTI